MSARRGPPRRLAWVPLICGAVAACGAPEPPPNLLLVTIETLRADHVSSYGYPRRTTPFLDRLAADGILFEHAWASSSWTAPSLASVLTSTYSWRHGVGRRGPTANSALVIPDELATLAESLRSAGYLTLGLTSSHLTGEERGFARGFVHYERLPARPSPAMTPTLDRWRDTMATGEPWFLWLHLFDPHGPYHARDPYMTEFWPASRPRHPELDAVASQLLLQQRDSLDAEEIAYLEALYDSEIRFADAFLAATVPRLPGVERTLVVVTSDHGEEFLEHGGLLHGQTLWEESIRIPLIVRLPGGGDGRRVTEPVSLVDVMPTLLAAAGVDPGPGIDGVSLLDLHARPKRRAIFAELLKGTTQRSATDGRWKLLRGLGPDRLFDLDADPRERHDRAAVQADASGRLAALLDALEAEARDGALEAAEVRVPPEEIEALRALGYVD